METLAVRTISPHLVGYPSQEEASFGRDTGVAKYSEHANMLVRCHEYQKALPQQSTAAVDQMKASYNNHFKKMQEYESAMHFSRLYELEADGAAEEAARTKAETEVASAATADRST